MLPICFCGGLEERLKVGSWSLATFSGTSHRCPGQSSRESKRTITAARSLPSGSRASQFSACRYRLEAGRFTSRLKVAKVRGSSYRSRHPAEPAAKTRVVRRNLPTAFVAVASIQSKGTTCWKLTPERR